MSALYDIPRQFIIALAEDGVIHYTFSYAFVVNGFLSALIIGPLLGGIGTMVVAKRMAFFSQAVGNAALTGVAIGVIIGESYTAPYMSMFSFCVLFALLLNFSKNRTKMSADTLIGVFLSISLAIGATALLWVSAKVNTDILDTVMFGSIIETTYNSFVRIHIRRVFEAVVATPDFTVDLTAKRITAAGGGEIRLTASFANAFVHEAIRATGEAEQIGRVGLDVFSSREVFALFMTELDGRDQLAEILVAT